MQTTILEAFLFYLRFLKFKFLDIKKGAEAPLNSHLILNITHRHPSFVQPPLPVIFASLLHRNLHNV
mgnify:CR=1 FL=1